MQLLKLLDWENTPERILYSYKDTGAIEQRWHLLNDVKTESIDENWYIETQHYGLMVYMAGVRFDDEEKKKLGADIINFGCREQKPAGDFDVHDAHHSASFFFEGLARFILLAEVTNFNSTTELDYLKEVLFKGVLYFYDRKSWDDEWWRDNMHHRFMVNSSILFLADEIFSELPEACIDQAYEWAEEGIRRLRDDGASTELGGHDTGYHSLAMTYSTGILMCDKIRDDFRARLEDYLRKSFVWIAGRISKDGIIDGSGNTRMTPESGENSRQDGVPKGIKFYETAFALRGAAVYFDDKEMHEVADRVMNGYIKA
ncbi:MAG: hypothetical protein ACYTFY_12500 [Planctomycetota bacterium]|jgi:hypothetical protein